MISEQIDVLNAAFSETGLSFALVNTTRTLDASWYQNVGPETSYQDAMKQALRAGGPNDLNLYSVGQVQERFMTRIFHGLTSALDSSRELGLACWDTQHSHLSMRVFLGTTVLVSTNL